MKLEYVVPAMKFSVSGNADPKAEIKKRTAAKMSDFLRPYLVLTGPATIEPMTQPINADDAAKPSSAGDRLKKYCKASVAPDITAVS